MGNRYHYFMFIFRETVSNHEIIEKLVAISKQRNFRIQEQSLKSHWQVLLSYKEEFGISSKIISVNQSEYTFLFGADFETENILYFALSPLNFLEQKYFPEYECILTVQDISKTTGKYLLLLLVKNDHLELLRKQREENEGEILDLQKSDQIRVLTELMTSLESDEFQKDLHQEIQRLSSKYCTLREKLVREDIQTEDLELVKNFIEIGIEHGNLINKQYRASFDKKITITNKEIKKLGIKIEQLIRTKIDNVDALIAEKSIIEHVKILQGWKEELEKRLQGSYQWSELELVLKLFEGIKSILPKKDDVKTLRKKFTNKKNPFEQFNTGLRLFYELDEDHKQLEELKPEKTYLDKLQMFIEIDRKITSKSKEINSQKSKIIKFLDYILDMLDFAEKEYRELVCNGIQKAIKKIEEKFWYNLQEQINEYTQEMREWITIEESGPTYLQERDLPILCNIFPKVIEKYLNDNIHLLATKSAMTMGKYVPVDMYKPYYYSLLSTLVTDWHLPELELLEPFYRYEKDEQYVKYIEKQVEINEYNEKHPLEANMKLARMMKKEGQITDKELKEMEETWKKSIPTPMSEILKKYEEKDKREKEENQKENKEKG